MTQYPMISRDGCNNASSTAWGSWFSTRPITQSRFFALMGTSCSLRWRVADDRELIWTVYPGHPIAAGIPAVIPLVQHEMYGEFFDIPVPDELVFISSFSGGEVFRSGCCFYRGLGKIFYFSPGHETNPIYHDPLIQRVIVNAVRWAQPNDDPSGVITGVRESPEGWFEQRHAARLMNKA